MATQQPVDSAVLETPQPPTPEQKPQPQTPPTTPTPQAQNLNSTPPEHTPEPVVEVLEPWVADATREDQRIRIQKIFSILDHKGIGVLDLEAVRQGLSKMKKMHVSYASELLHVCDSTKDGTVTFSEFEAYIHAKEKELWHLFKKIDESGDGFLQPEELSKALHQSGVVLNTSQLDAFIGQIDAKKDGTIDFIEWRDYLILLPKHANLNNIYHFYRKSVSHIDVEGNVHIAPPKGETPLRTTGYFLAGGFAGAISRTCTAPLDRLKVYLVTQTHPSNAIRKASKFFTPWSKSSLPQDPPKLPLADRIRKGRALEAIKHLYNNGGLKSFFRGNGINVIKIAPESAIKFLCYERGKAYLASRIVQPTSQTQPTASSRSSDANAIGITGRFLAGGVAGMTSQLCMYPLETVKTRIMAVTQGIIQSHPSHTGAHSSGETQKKPSHPVVKPPTTSCFSTVPVIQTSKSLVASSLHPNIIRSSAAIHFMFRSRACMTSLSTQREIQKSVPVTPPRTLASVSGPQIASKTRFIIVKTIRQMWKEGGIRTFYKGLAPAMLGVFPYAAIDMSIFESLKLQCMSRRAGAATESEPAKDETPSAVILLGCGTVSGLVGASSVYPLSLVRTILQAQGTAAHPATYNGTIDVIKKTFAREGIRGFYKGLAPTLMKVVPSASIAYVTYEKSLQQFGLK